MKRLALIILCLVTVAIMFGCATGSAGGPDSSSQNRSCH